MPSSSNQGRNVLAAAIGDDSAAWRDMDKFASWGDLPGFQLACASIPATSCEKGSGWLPVDYAIFHGQVDLIRWWVEKCPGFNDQWKSRAIFRALQGRQGFLTDLLVSFGCSVQVLDDRLRSPLHVAAWLGEVAAIAPLVAAGASLHQRDDSMMSPLRWAIRGGHQEVVARLLALGADPSIKDPSGVSDESYAISSCREDIIQMLRPHVEHRILSEKVSALECSEGSGRRL